MLNGRFFKFSSRTLVTCPFKETDFGIISPRNFKEFSTLEIANVPEIFTQSLVNSFPDLGDRARFVNKFYQTFLCHELPHKTRKLVVVGDKDSGKTSWARVFFGIMNHNKIAILTKEENFGASMINDDTELLWVDEWSKAMLPDNLLKTLLQGGPFAQSIKFLSPKMQDMQAGVYITCNKIPDYGDEQPNIERRLYICHTKELQQKLNDAPQWIENNAMRCLLWMANFINSNIRLIEKEERFYELPRNVDSKAFSRDSDADASIDKMKNATLFTPIITSTPDLKNQANLCVILNEDNDKGNQYLNFTFRYLIFEFKKCHYCYYHDYCYYLIYIINVISYIIPFSTFEL